MRIFSVLSLWFHTRIVKFAKMFYNRVRLYDENAGGAGALGEGNTPSGRYAVREQNTQDQSVKVRERTAFNLSMQWATESGDGNIYLYLSATGRKQVIRFLTKVVVELITLIPLKTLTAKLTIIHLLMLLQSQKLGALFVK